MYDVRRLVRQGTAEGALRFALLKPALGDPALFAEILPRLAREVLRSGVWLFPDLEVSPDPEFETDLDRPGDSSDHLGAYLREVRRIAPTTRAEETTFARGLELARAVLRLEVRFSLARGEVARALAAVGADPLFLDSLRGLRRRGARGNLPPRVERIARRLSDARRVRNLLVARNLQLVPLFARRYRRLGVPYLDLLQEGNAALLRAADKFDWRRGVRFSTYAQWWIQQAVLKSLYTQSRVVRLPVYLGQEMKRLNAARGLHYGGFGRTLTPEELSASLDQPLGRVRRALRSSAPTLSLDGSGPDGDAPLSERLPDARQGPFLEQLADDPAGPPLRRRLEDLLALLSERERRILRLRFGLDEAHPRTLEELSLQFSVSRERIRQIQVRALAKLRAFSERSRLSSYLG